MPDSKPRFRRALSNRLRQSSFHRRIPRDTGDQAYSDQYTLSLCCFGMQRSCPRQLRHAECHRHLALVGKHPPPHLRKHRCIQNTYNVAAVRGERNEEIWPRVSLLLRQGLGSGLSPAAVRPPCVMGL